MIMMPLFRMILTVWVWAFRHIHVGLDTIVLYGVLRERNMDDGRAAGGSGRPARGSGGSNSKPTPATTRHIATTPSV